MKPYLRPKFDVYNKKIITKSYSQLDLYFIRKGLGPVSNATVQEVGKTKQIGAKFKKTFPFLKTINFTVINVIRCQLKSLKCSFIST